MEQFTTEDMLRGQSEVWRLMFAFSHSMALKCAVDLRIPDIIHSHGGPMTLPSIVSKIHSTTGGETRLARIMRLLVRDNVFVTHKQPNGGDTLYGLTPTSMWLLRGSEHGLTPLIQIQNDKILMDPWQYLSEYVRDGSFCFEMANNGHDLWEFTSKNPKFSEAFNAGMESTAKITIKAIIEECKHIFQSISSLVDVGGGNGCAIVEIVKAYSHIKGINFDLPHVIATAKEFDGVSHVGGSFFEAIPPADAVFMKWILHDWEDNDCVRILKNCRKAIPEEKGKLILSEIVVDPESKELFDETRVVLDLTMIAHTDGKERTEEEWRSLLEKGGFPRCNVFKIPGLFSIIEGFPI